VLCRVETYHQSTEENGYNVNFPLATNDGVNVYDGTVVISSSAAQKAEIKFGTNAARQCNQLKDRVSNIPGAKTITCDTTTFELKFEI